MQDYLARLPTRKRDRSADAMVRDIQREFLNSERWLSMTVPKVTDRGVTSMVTAIKSKRARRLIARKFKGDK
ncbi:hypothetical protein BC360_27150 [Ensifer sp. LC163]|nr:hypothetical protein BC363_28600 [Ensifer sp. LC384]OCP21847.1 hypothetical protein BC361_26215 [Ensifer sp. LC54]OCP35766.1 hypothetical protein BC360_27150 [Ensifer sp. LC163]